MLHSYVIHEEGQQIVIEQIALTAELSRLNDWHQARQIKIICVTHVCDSKSAAGVPIAKGTIKCCHDCSEAYGVGRSNLDLIETLCVARSWNVVLNRSMLFRGIYVFK